MNPRLIAACALLAVAGSLAASEPEHLELDTSRVTGNRELPRVMAIVPWKQAPAAELPGRPALSLLDEALAPADRLVLRREAAHWNALMGSRLAVPGEEE